MPGSDSDCGQAFRSADWVASGRAKGSDVEVRAMLEYERALLNGGDSMAKVSSIDGQLAKTIRLLVDTLGPIEDKPAELAALSQLPADWELPNPFGRFHILEKLGTGAFGIVWKALDPNTQRHVAIKALHPELRGTPAISHRFLTESKAAARLNHPNIVRVHEAGTIDGIDFIASEYIEGERLTTSASGKPSFSPTEAAELVAQLASAIAHSHQQGVLHRDIKPDNVIVEVQTLPGGGERLLPRLTDFGLARLQDQRGELSTIGLMVGTLDYMAPEQMSGDPAMIGPPADVYSLGLLLFELLTGVHPRRSSGNIARAIEASQQAPSPKSKRREIPGDLDAICVRCLQKLPEARYASAADLHRDLENF